MAKGDGAHRYYDSETNPNDSIGGGGCACGDQMVCDRGGPYRVFTHTTNENGLSPHIVVCHPCLVAPTKELTQVGAGDVLDAEAELVSVERERPEPHENPVAEGDYPDLDAGDDDLAI